MRDADHLRSILSRINGRGYKAYKDIRGIYRFRSYDLCVDHVQGDPYAAPSRIRVVLSQDRAGFPPEAYGNNSRRIALEDYLTRSFAGAVHRYVTGRRGSGKSGAVTIDTPHQEILERTSCFVNAETVEVRFRVGLPAAGRRILGHEAEEIFFREIPRVVDASLRYESLDETDLKRHLDVNEDQDVLRDQLSGKRFAAFIADGSVLPRRSGIDDRPLQRGQGNTVIPFASPDSLRITLHVPHAGSVSGMAIPEGITLIVGGGFHGKSTLLRAIERGVYNHVPGDGRELVVTRPDAVKIRSEDGRSVAGVDIRPFIDNLPYRSDTGAFTTENASGSTSQAANIVEALEVGCRLLLIDEDTSATNFMIRDERMQELVVKDREPITPFLDKVQLLHRDLGVSTILVMGGSGDYFDVADRVIMMDAYVPKDVTEKAAEIVARDGTSRREEGGERFGEVTSRIPQRHSFDPSRGRREVRIDAKGLKSIIFGTQDIDLSAVEQLVSASQTRAIGDIIHYYAIHHAGGEYPLREGLERVMMQIDRQGLDVLSDLKEGAYARPRLFEVAAAVNRMRSLRVRRMPDS
ncbi:MAG: ABC-ATPase domain-containing protein [bacterium]|nr:MAG: ABC-ATPase domain-containing protein [bacterium]